MNSSGHISIAEKQRQLETTLGAMKNSQERFAYFVQRGRASGGLAVDQKTDPFRLEGCLARTWLLRRFEDGRCYFQADSESAIIKGLAVMLCDFYSGQTAAEILSVHPRFLEQFGITQHLTPNRRNSIARLFEEIERFAESHL